jgi:hypothetical protein
VVFFDEPNSRLFIESEPLLGVRCLVGVVVLHDAGLVGANVRVQGPAEGEARSEPASAACRRSPGTKGWAPCAQMSVMLSYASRSSSPSGAVRAAAFR